MNCSRQYLFIKFYTQFRQSSASMALKQEDDTVYSPKSCSSNQVQVPGMTATTVALLYSVPKESYPIKYTWCCSEHRRHTTRCKIGLLESSICRYFLLVYKHLYT